MTVSPAARRILATLCITEIVSWGVLYYAFGVFLPAMRADLGSTVQLTTAFSIALLVAGIASVVIGRLMDSGHSRLIMTGGSLLGSILVVAWSQARFIWQLDLIWAGLGVAMALTLYVPAFALIAKWFGPHRNRGLTTLTLFGALASFVFSPLSAELIQLLGWRRALLALAVILAGITIPAHALFLRNPPLEPSLSAPPIQSDFRNLVSSPTFWILGVSFALTALAGTAVTIHLVSFVVSHGHGVTYAAAVAGMVGLGQIPGRVLYGLAVRRVSTRTAAGVVFALCAVTISVLTATVSSPILIGVALLFGMANGTSTLAKATLVGDIYGGARYGTMMGAMSAWASGAQALAPILASMVYLIVRGYSGLFSLVALVYLLGAFLVLFSTTKVASTGR